MKRSWIVRRTTLGHHDAARRWDQAYVHLLCWALPKETINKEVPDASGDLRPGFDPPPSAGPQKIDQQVARLERHAERQGWATDERRIYIDEGYSGASLSRPGLDALRDAAAMAEFEVVLVAAPHRLARNGKSTRCCSSKNCTDEAVG